MVSLIIIAVIIGAMALVLILAPHIRRWIKGRMLKENDETIPLYNCSIASRGNESGTSNSEDVYDCVEANKEETEPELKT